MKSPTLRLQPTVYPTCAVLMSQCGCLKSERLIGASIVARNASRLYFYGEASGLDLETGVLAHGTFSMNCLGKTKVVTLVRLIMVVHVNDQFQ